MKRRAIQKYWRANLTNSIGSFSVSLSVTSVVFSDSAEKDLSSFHAHLKEDTSLKSGQHGQIVESFLLRN